MTPGRQEGKVCEGRSRSDLQIDYEDVRLRFWIVGGIRSLGWCRFGGIDGMMDDPDYSGSDVSWIPVPVVRREVVTCLFMGRPLLQEG